jgi:Protein of unknown function (DUF3788)
MVSDLSCNHWFCYRFCYLETLENEKSRGLYLPYDVCSTQYNCSLGGKLAYLRSHNPNNRCCFIISTHKENVLMGRMMEERPFCNKTSKPTNENIKKVLASTFSYYNQLMENTKTFSKEWNYSKSSGWMQKVFDKKKALLYLLPLTNQFIISMAIRENEREILLKDKEIVLQLKQAKKYSEGFAMRFVVTNEETFSRTTLFINKIITLRK